MDILVIAAHPDDETLGCGGAILKHVKNGDKVFICILTDGATARYKKNIIKTLRRDALNSAELLGVNKIIFKNLPNQLLDAIPLLKIVKTIESVINEIKPDIIYTHDRGDLNCDHVVVYEATIVAARPTPNNKISKLLTYFVPSSSEYNDIDEDNMFKPNIFLDIKNEINKKIRAFSCYQTEIKQYPHPRSRKALKIYAQRWGIQVGIQYAEPFRLVREVR